MPDVAREPVLQTYIHHRWACQNVLQLDVKGDMSETHGEDPDVSGLSGRLCDPVSSILAHEDVPPEILEMDLSSYGDDLGDRVLDRGSCLDGVPSGVVHSTHPLAKVDSGRAGSVQVRGRQREIDEERVCGAEQVWARGGCVCDLVVVREDERGQRGERRSASDLHRLDGIERLLDRVDRLPLNEMTGRAG
jgi:hypothetical protein